LGFSLQPGFFLALLAEFPYDALGAEFTISTGIRARLAVFQAFLAIADFHFLAFYIGLSIIVKTAFHTRVTSFQNRQFDNLVKRPYRRHSREGGSPELLEFSGFPFSRE